MGEKDTIQVFRDRTQAGINWHQCNSDFIPSFVFDIQSVDVFIFASS